MNVASLPLSKELYELSGWDDCWFQHLKVDNEWGLDFSGAEALRKDSEIDEWHPAYDLGYLLRKLPNYKLEHNGNSANAVTCGYLADNKGRWIFGSANTPEDAACKLAIELFKQGVLK